MQEKYQEFINQVKDVVSNADIPPHYDPDEWKGKSFNCYAYALRICLDLGRWSTRIRPGFVSRGEKNHYENTEECLLKHFQEDCEALGLELSQTSIDESIGDNEYKIAVYIAYDDFHFVRQDSNGQWSQKRGWYRAIHTLKEEEVPRTMRKYRYLGVFKVSKKQD